MSECPEPTPADNKIQSNNDKLDWDDDNFEPTEVEFPIKPKADQESDNAKAEMDNWLTPVNCDESEPDTTVHIQPKKYLTKQFERLATPASGKKLRCVACTRPVLDDSSRYCPKCQKRGNSAKEAQADRAEGRDGKPMDKKIEES